MGFGLEAVAIEEKVDIIEANQLQQVKGKKKINNGSNNEVKIFQSSWRNFTGNRKKKRRIKGGDERDLRKRKRYGESP